MTQTVLNRSRPLLDPRWYLQRASCLLDAHFGAVKLDPVPLVAWDERMVCRATLPDGRRAFVKIDKRVERHRRELVGLMAAQSAGVPVPEVLFSRTGEPCILALLEIAARRSLRDGAESQDWALAGQSARKLHEASIPEEMQMFEEGCGDWAAHVLSRTQYECSEAQRASRLSAGEAGRALRELSERFAGMRLKQKALIHGDLQVRHVLFHAERAWLVDFGDAGWGDPVWDLTVLYHWNPQWLPYILRGYEANSEVRERLEYLGPAYSVLRHLRVARWYHENSFDAQRSCRAARLALQQLTRN